MKKTNRKNNYAITLMCIILIIPFLSIAGIKSLLTENMYQSWQTLALVIFTILLIIKSRSIQMNWIVCLFGLYEAIILATSTYHHGFSPGLTVTIITPIILFALLQTDCYYEMLSGICVVVVGAMLINFPTILTNWGNENAKFFIGGKNALSMFLTPGVFLLLLNSLEQHEKLTKPVICGVVFAMISILLGSSGTGIVVALCAVLFWFISSKAKPNKGLYMGVLFTIYLLFLVFSESFFLTDIWLEFTDMLGKDSTLTSRTTIWEKAIEIFQGRPWIGAGRGVALRYINSMGYVHTIYEAHNFILEILMEGGIICLTLYAALFIRAVRLLDMNNTKHRIVFISLVVLLINGLTESNVNNYLVVATLGVACRYANEQKNEQRKQMRANQRKEMQLRQGYELRRVRKVKNGQQI